MQQRRCHAAVWWIASIGHLPWTSALAAPASPLALSCASCHVPGLTQTVALPSLDSLNHHQIAAALRGFANGQRSGTVMPRIAPALSDDEIDALATEFADGTSGEDSP